MNKVSVVISSCDRYSYLWDIQIQVFEKYWNDCPYQIHLISDTIKYPYTDFGKLKIHNFTTDLTPTGPQDWSNNLLRFLQASESEYIVYFQEDYIVINHVDTRKLEDLITYSIDNQINYLRFYVCPPGNGEKIYLKDNIVIREILKSSPWRSNLSVAIWKKSTLLDILQKNISITPWDFEHVGCNEYDKFYCIDTVPEGQTDIINWRGMYGSSNGYAFYPHIIEFLNSENIKKLNGEDINFSIKL